MQIQSVPHRWSVSPKAAVRIQRRLASAVRIVPLTRDVRVVTGVDMAFSSDGARCVAGAVSWDLARQEVIESKVAILSVSFPYVPGLLSFREGRAVLAALRKLRHEPDMIMCDGHGVAHPRRFGIACHIGVLCDIPAIGCAKSVLIGQAQPVGERRGARSALLDGGERIGTVLRTRPGVKPVIASVGHRVDLVGAERVILKCGGGYRLPEPTRLADRLVAQVKRDQL